MYAVVVYESMYGNTRAVAEAIAEGLRPGLDAEVRPACRAAERPTNPVDLLVVGGPTHAWTMSSTRTRTAAASSARKPGSSLHLQPEAEQPGLREWLAGDIRPPRLGAAVFDTRMDMRSMFTGRASRPISRRLRRHGIVLLCESESFFVTKANVLLDGQLDRARRWGHTLAMLSASRSPSNQ